MPANDTQKQQFLDALSMYGVVGTAIQTVPSIEGGEHISRGAVTRWRLDPAFELAYQDAMDAATDLLEAEARRRAHIGVVRERVIGSGENARFIEEVHYSDPLLLALLKGGRPDKFADRTKSEISGPGGGQISFNDTSAAARIGAILDGVKARRDSAEVDPFD